MMGAGKSTVGRLLAERAGWPHADSDEEVALRTGRSVAEVWQSAGEAGFRAEESRALEELLGRPGPLVVSLGGGAVLDPVNRHRIAAAGTVVWLRASVQTLSARLAGTEGRPLLRGERAAEALARLSAAREPVYGELADVVVDVEGLSPEEVADRLESELAQVAERERARA